MLVFEAKLQGRDEQYRIVEETIRTARFVRNSCLRYWIDKKGVKGASRHSFYIPRPTVYSRLRSVWGGELEEELSSWR